MNPYDAARNLAKAIKASEEHRIYSEAQEKIKKEEGAEKFISEFRTLQFELQTCEVTGKEVPEEKKQRIEEMAKLAQMDPVMMEYLTAEFRFGTMLSDIQKIIAEASDIWVPGIEDNEEDGTEE